MMPNREVINRLALVMYRLGQRGLLQNAAGKDVWRPEQLDNALFFDSEEAALNAKAELDPTDTKFMLVAWQQKDMAVTKNAGVVRDPPRMDGQVYLDEITRSDDNTFNYSSWHMSLGVVYWEYAHAYFRCLDGKNGLDPVRELALGEEFDVIFHTSKLVKDKKFSDTVIYILAPMIPLPAPRRAR